MRKTMKIVDSEKTSFSLMTWMWSYCFRKSFGIKWSSLLMGCHFQDTAEEYFMRNELGNQSQGQGYIKH